VPVDHFFIRSVIFVFPARERDAFPNPRKLKNDFRGAAGAGAAASGFFAATETAVLDFAFFGFTGVSSGGRFLAGFFAFAAGAVRFTAFFFPATRFLRATFIPNFLSALILPPLFWTQDSTSIDGCEVHA
jgi:hypothetical protein